MDDPKGKGYYDIDGKSVTINKLCREDPAWAASIIEHLKKRLRTTAQILIAAIGADGPMNAEDAARKAVAVIEAARDN